jgi:hypothetical protein
MICLTTKSGSEIAINELRINSMESHMDGEQMVTSISFGNETRRVLESIEQIMAYIDGELEHFGGVING